MRKATYTDIPTFYKYVRYIDGKGNKGYLYYLSETLSDDAKNMLKQKYNNINFYKCNPQYAPEIEHNIIFLSDKVIK